MATGGLYGTSTTGAIVAEPGAESSGLYGNNTNFGGTYFLWFVFQVSATAPATPTGGSWDFVNNTGTPPSGWSNNIPTAPAHTVWVSTALVNSRNTGTLSWSTPGLFGNFTEIAVGSTTTGLPGTSANVTNSGTNTNVVLNFTIPRGDKGDKGDTGDAATVAVGTTTTGNPGTAASVTNSGDTHNAVFNFTIPRGAGVNSGGTAGQFLTKASSADYDTTWTTITGTLSYQGTWNASTNTPALTSSVGTSGYYYVVATAGTTNLNGITDWQVGDWAIFNGSVWQKIDNTDLVTSVNGKTGAVVLNASDVGALSGATSSDGSITVSQVGTVIDLVVSAASPASTLLLQVRNNTGATLTKGTVVYINGAVGQLPTVAKAQANSDATSAQTQGLITADIANNATGYVTIVGLVTGLDTSAYSDGQQLYLSGTTAGAMTGTKPQAPIHLVYVAVVVYAHPTQGKLQVKVQNGYELDEIHDVKITSRAAYNLLQVDSTNTYWQNVPGPSSNVVGVSDTQTLTNKTINASNNTLSNIANSSLVYSSITINGTPVSLGGSISVGGTTTNAVTFNTTGGAAAGTSFNGSAAVTVDYSTVGADPAGTAIAMAIALG